MADYSKGNVVVVLYPFTDGRGYVPRPALVVSADSHNAQTQDVIILAQITGNVTAPVLAGDFLLEDWQAANLNLPSKARMTKLITVSKALIRRNIGHLS